ncbi:MAG: DinB family protein [Flavobacterium sp.]|uniref:DinB family protein n=1 Tax=Flavobacterium sp. TaxID=239 RepID=UPI003264531E
MNFSAVRHTLEELKDLLNQLSDKDFALPILYLGNSSVGEHTRHIIEMFQCLLNSYESGLLNYDDRKRNNLIQTDTNFAIQSINDIIKSIEKENKNIVLKQLLFKAYTEIETNYFRELLYNLEHCIHHQALIKVAVFQMEDIQLTETFGIASSTIEYRKQCAQ